MLVSCSMGVPSMRIFSGTGLLPNTTYLVLEIFNDNVFAQNHWSSNFRSSFIMLLRCVLDWEEEACRVVSSAKDTVLELRMDPGRSFV